MQPPVATDGGPPWGLPADGAGPPVVPAGGEVSLKLVFVEAVLAAARTAEDFLVRVAVFVAAAAGLVCGRRMRCPVSGWE